MQSIDADMELKFKPVNSWLYIQLWKCYDGIRLEKIMAEDLFSIEQG